MSVMVDEDKRMTETESGCFHKAYYRHPSEMNQEIARVHNRADIDYEDDELCHYSDASVFQMGSCQLFSLALYSLFHEKYNYMPVLMADKMIIDGGTQGITHAFCVAKYKGQMAYIDVRGVTTDKEEFIQPYRTKVKQNYTPQKTNDIIKNLSENERIGFAFAKQIIEDNLEYYSLE